MKGPGVTRLFGVGAHFAQQKNRRHPSMKPFIAGKSSRTEIFDLVKTDEQLTKAKEAIAALSAAGKTVLFVGGKTEVAPAVRDTAQRLGAPYVATRWLGGTISNFSEIKKRIDRLADLVAKRESGELAKMYTKLERLYIDREIERLTKRLDGITALAARPDAAVVVDTRHEAHAVKELRAARIPVIGIMNSDCNAADAAYPVMMNDASRNAVSLVLDELAAAYQDAKKG